MSPGKFTLPKVFTSLSQRYRILIGFCIITAAILVQQLAAFTVVNAFTQSLSNWMHVPLFAGITATAMWIWPKTTWWKLVIGVGLLASASEAVQFYTGRLPSIADFSKDCLGAGITWLCLRQMRLPNIGAWVLIITVATLMVPSTYLLSYQYQQQIFPTLFTPDDWRSMQLTRLKATGKITTEHSWTRYSDQSVLIATWHKTRWPGIHLNEPIGDWQAYKKFRFDIFNLEPGPQPITLAVRHVGKRGTARHRKIVLQPGENLGSINLQDLACLDSGEPATIRHVMFYTSEEHGGKRILLGRVWLE